MKSLLLSHSSLRVVVTLLVIGLSVRSGFQVNAAASNQSLLTEWTVPTRASGPWALTLDSSGSCCWFLEYYGNRVGHLNPSNNTFSEWAIPSNTAYPYSLTVTSDSGTPVLWGTEFGRDRIFAFYPTSGTFLEYTLANYTSGSTGTTYISAEPPGKQLRIWFTESLRNANGEFIYNSNTHNVTYYQDSFPIAVGGGAYGVFAGSNAVWFAGLSALVRWDRASQLYSIWPLPGHGSAVGRSIALDQNGQVWYTQGVADGNNTDNYVGVLRENSTLQEWRIPSSGSDPRGIVINPLTQEPWVAEQSPSVGNGTIATLNDSSGGTMVSPSLITSPSGGTLTVLSPITKQETVSTTTVTSHTTSIQSTSNGAFTGYALGPTQPRDVLVDSSGNIWVSEPAQNKIARLTPPQDFALRISPPAVSLSQGSYGTATVTGTSISGYSGNMSLTISAAPSGVTLSNFNHNPLSLQSGGTASAQFTINVAPNAPNVTSTIVIEGSDGLVTHTASLILTITNSSSTAPTQSRCFIATATYGSELSPEVQLLRNFRDHSLMKSKVGSSFLVVFNAWYYSFSPSTAGYISGHEIARIVMRAVLYPLIGFLFLASQFYSSLSAYPEMAALLSGLLACLLIGAFYIGLPLGFLARRRLAKCSLNMTTLAVLLLAPIGAILVSLEFSWTEGLMISSSIAVLATLFVAGLSMAKAVSRALS